MIEAYFMSILFGTIGGFVACLVYDHTLPIGKLPALKRERRKALETENIPEPPKKYPNEEDLKKLGITVYKKYNEDYDYFFSTGFKFDMLEIEIVRLQPIDLRAIADYIEGENERIKSNSK